MSAPNSEPLPPRRPFPLTRFLIPAAALLAFLTTVPFGIRRVPAPEEGDTEATRLAVVHADTPLFRALDSLRFPFQLDREEGFLLNQAVRLSHGETPYPPIDRYPYLVGNYPPVYPFVYAIFVKLFGPSLPLGRLINLLAAAAILAGLAWTVASRTRRIVPAVLAPLLFAATWGFNQWIAYARVDILALCLTLWGLLWFVRRPEEGGARGTAFLFALALFTRQTLLAAPLAALATLVLRRNWRGSRRLLLPLVLWTGGSYGLLFLITGGKAWSDLVTYNVNPFHWNQVQVWAAHLWRFEKFSIVLAALTIMCLTYLEKWEGWRRNAEVPKESGEQGGGRVDSVRVDEKGDDLASPKDTAASDNSPSPEDSPDASGVPAPRDEAADSPGGTSSLRGPETKFLSAPETFYLLFAFGAFFMVGKEGAASNYLLEFHMALALFLGLHVGRVQNLGEDPIPHHSLGLLNVLMFLCISFHAVNLLRLREMVFSERPPGALEMLAGTEVLESVQGVAGDVITEEPIYAMLTGHRVLFQPFIMSELAREGLWDQTRFVDDLRSGRFAVLVTTEDIYNENQYFIAWTPKMRTAIREGYVQDDRVDHGPRWRYWIYKPRKNQPHASAGPPRFTR